MCYTCPRGRKLIHFYVCVLYKTNKINTFYKLGICGELYIKSEWRYYRQHVPIIVLARTQPTKN